MVTGRLNRKSRVICLGLVLAAGALVLSSDRLHRFTTLGDTDYVEGRVAGSVNRHFLEIMIDYPMGNGLGGGGTPMPYFLQQYVRHPIAIENEYGRMLAEQGIIGLLLWVSFLVWIFCRSTPFENAGWREGRRVAWFSSLFAVGTAFIGVGIFVGVPPILYLTLGWFSVRPAEIPTPRYILVRRLVSHNRKTVSSSV
jgi:hypothetical protein